MDDKELTVYETKNDYVTNQLTDLLGRADRGIVRVEYKTGNNEEFVDVIFNNQNKKTIFVTGDSLMALTYDVVKEII